MNRKVALVTGASSGIGKAVVISLVEAGYSVMAAGRDRIRTEQVGRQCEDTDAWVGDITSADSCADLVSACIDRFGGLDLLVNNAGIIHPANAEGTSDEEWMQTMAINLNAPFYLSRESVPHLRKTKGSILNIASGWGLRGGQEAVAYCASKGGLVLMTKAMALDHAIEGIRINAICPGDVDTPMLHGEGMVRGLEPEETVREAAKLSPSGKVTTSDEVASLVVFLASDAAAQITGAAIPIDGGNSA